MTTSNPLPGRPFIGTLSVVLVALLLLIDTEQSAPINPFNAPNPIALGSGVAPEGAHCTQP